MTNYDYGFRIYNPAIGRFLSVDPLMKSYPWYTPYQFAGNKPIAAIDMDGLEPKWFMDLAKFFGFDLSISQEHSEDIREEAKYQSQMAHRREKFQLVKSRLESVYEKEMMMFSLIPGGSVVPELADYQVHRKTGSEALAGAGAGIAIELWGGEILKPISKYLFKYSKQVAGLVKETYRGFFREGEEAAQKEIITLTNSGTYEDAMKIAQSIFEDVDDWTYRKSPHTGKVDGLVSESDPSKYLRLDWDDAKGAHINWNRGKERGAVLFNHSVQSVEAMINKLTSRVGKIKPTRLKVANKLNR